MSEFIDTISKFKQIGKVQTKDYDTLVLLCIISIYFTIIRLLEYLCNRIIKFIYKKKNHNKAWCLVACIVMSLIGYSGYLTSFKVKTCDEYHSYYSAETDLVELFLFSYFTYDILSHKLKNDMLIHHIIGILGISISTYMGYTKYLSHVLLYTELSTVFLSLMNIFDNVYKTIMMVLFFITFTITRIMFLPNILRTVYICKNETIVDYIAIIIMILFLFLNLYWYYLIIKIMIIKICKKKLK